ncbi:MAG: MBL fold metallo-hydrolase [Ruminococcaceae bacterium]|nr:MBL fold metallo-hydrolase [Oscillospiraceae bacterium]
MAKFVKHWEGLFPPFRILSDLYFVGTQPASSHIVKTSRGLIMLDSGYQHSLYAVIDNIYRVGLDPHDVKYLFITHGHIDHFGSARAIRELTGARIVIGRRDLDACTGKRELSFARELDMEFNETFEPDILLDDGDVVTLGDVSIRAVATPGHTEGAMSYFFNICHMDKSYRVALHGGMGVNTLTEEYLTRYGLSFGLREDFRASMLRLAKEKVDVFLGNHMQHNNTPQRYERLMAGDELAFYDDKAWGEYNLGVIGNLDKLIEKERIGKGGAK